ncbi:helix-turn-helix transcriptional regulator [Chryseobacterium zhengzhouense]|uniref:Helix-turn-helix transcriptional regulator n=1 Tax=Chryseobacterium zhengzhouense TaxID=1636086 RepID=A0ABW2LXE7_9FLAO
MSVQNRFKLFIAYLKANKLIKTQKELGFRLGFETESAFSQVVNGKVPFSETLYAKLKTLYSFLDINWLKHNIGEMINEELVLDNKNQAFQDLLRVTNNIKPINSHEGRIINESELIPVKQYIIPLKGQAGLRKAFFFPDEYIDSNFEKETIYVKPSERGTYYKIEVDGNSMVGKLDPGDWTRCEDIPKMYWIDKGTFKADKIYCLIHRTRGILFKRISKVLLENVTLTSDNPDKMEYPDETFDLNEFSKILIVRKIEKDA